MFGNSVQNAVHSAYYINGTNLRRSQNQVKLVVQTGIFYETIVNFVMKEPPSCKQRELNI